MEYAILAGLVGGVWAILLWLSIIVWVYRDVRDRTRDVGLQVLAVFIVMMFFPGFNIPGLALYLMLRPQNTLEEAYARSLEEEALLREIGDEGLCPSCRRFAERNWRTCPFCQTQLKDVCTKCEQLLSFNWFACPYCGTPRQGAVMPEPAIYEPVTSGGDGVSEEPEPARVPRRRSSAALAEDDEAKVPRSRTSAGTQ
jgi:RNA polymerase subunit RPABC4/transcription elongation factor Spt4